MWHTLLPGFLSMRLLGRDERVLAPRPRVTRLLAVHVPRGATRELPRASGRVQVHCRRGEVWLTHDGDPRDVVLRADQSHALDRMDRLTAHALQGDCALEIQVDCA
jgi:hypothetical protein